MSSYNYIETHTSPGTAFSDLPGLGKFIEPLNYFDPSSAGPSYSGYVNLVHNHLGFYEAEEDSYSSHLRIFCSAKNIAQALALNMTSGQITLLDLPEGNPASVYIITPGNVDIFVDGSKAKWSL